MRNITEIRKTFIMGEGRKGGFCYNIRKQGDTQKKNYDCADFIPVPHVCIIL
jgi:hypothetical protein